MAASADSADSPPEHVNTIVRRPRSGPMAVCAFSVSSSAGMSGARATPSRSKNASYSSSDPASELVCVAVTWAPTSLAPDLTTVTGMPRSSARAAASANSAASRRPSR